MPKVLLLVYVRAVRASNERFLGDCLPALENYLRNRPKIKNVYFNLDFRHRGDGSQYINQKINFEL